LFRHFATREQLIADALSSVLDWYEQQVHQVQGAGTDLETWLSESVLRILQMHRGAGHGLWQLAVAKDDELSPEMARVNQRRRSNRRTMTTAMAATAWRRAGGQGECPGHVVDAFALTLSTFATHSLLDDFGSSDESFTRCSTMMLSLILSATAKGPQAG
jgi:AcrR family transcriptional regulator